MADDVTPCADCGKPAERNHQGNLLVCPSESCARGPLCAECMEWHIHGIHTQDDCFEVMGGDSRDEQRELERIEYEELLRREALGEGW